MQKMLQVVRCPTKRVGDPFEAAFCKFVPDAAQTMQRDKRQLFVCAVLVLIPRSELTPDRVAIEFRQEAPTDTAAMTSSANQPEKLIGMDDRLVDSNEDCHLPPAPILQHFTFRSFRLRAEIALRLLLWRVPRRFRRHDSRVF